MLASFESFLQTAKVQSVEEDYGNFDQAEQTDDPVEREGIDTPTVDKFAESYYRRFGEPMPHPKMDFTFAQCITFISLSLIHRISL